MLKRHLLVLMGIVLATVSAGVARADLAPEPPRAGEDGSSMIVVAGVALVAIIAAVAVMLLRRRR